MQKIRYKQLSRSQGKRFCDELWTLCVKGLYENKCAICGDQEMLNAHHLITKRVSEYRWIVSNGIALCPKHHKFDIRFSAHTAPWSLEKWVIENKPDIYTLWCERRNNIPEEHEIQDYDLVYFNLEQKYKKITGQYFKIKRINSHLLSLNYDKIYNDFVSNMVPISKLIEKYKVSKPLMLDFLKRNKLIKKTNKTQSPIALLQVDFHYISDTIGSRTEGTK